MQYDPEKKTLTRTPEDQLRHRDIRERFRHKPTIEEMKLSGELSASPAESRAAEFRIPLRVLLHPVGDGWVAHGLEFDIAAAGPTREDALRRLSMEIFVQAEMAIRENEIRRLLMPTSRDAAVMFAAGKKVDVPAETFPLPVYPVAVEGFEVREYVPAMDPKSKAVTLHLQVKTQIRTTERVGKTQSQPGPEVMNPEETVRRLER